MLIEAILLLAFLLTISLSGTFSIGLLLIGVLVVVLCVPVIRLIIQGAPPFVPTPSSVIDAMMRLANIKPNEVVYDLGCGDGRLLLAAAQKKATCIGYELSVPTLLLAKWRTRRHANISVRYADFWTKHYGDADVVLCYLLADKMRIFEEVIWPQLQPGCRVVSHSFVLPSVKPEYKEGSAVLYVKK